MVKNKIKISVIKLEKLSKKLRDKVFLTGRLNTQSFIISVLPPKSLLFTYFIK